MSAGRFIAVVGPSGVGKDSVMTALADSFPGYALVRRVITRAPEAGGEDHTAVSEARFAEMCEAGAFALHWQAHGLFYGIPATVDDDLARGRDLLANLSRGVLQAAKARFGRFVVLSLTAPPEVLAHRLAARGRESADDIAARLKRAEFALPEGLPVVEIANAGTLRQTAARAHDALQALSL